MVNLALDNMRKYVIINKNIRSTQKAQNSTKKY